MKLSVIIRAACAMAVFTTISLHAAVLANYPFTGSSLASTDTNAVSTASAISLGSGLNASTHFVTTSGNPSPAFQVNTSETDGTSFATAVTGNDFFLFALAPANGADLELNTLTFDLAVSTAAVSTNVRVQLSANGTTYLTLDSVTNFSNSAFTAQTFDLTPANNLLPSGSPLYVRFVVFDGSNNAALYTAFDNIVVNGTVTAIVPEPGTNALLAAGILAAAGVFAVRRRQTALV